MDEYLKKIAAAQLEREAQLRAIEAGDPTSATPTPSPTPTPTPSPEPTPEDNQRQTIMRYLQRKIRGVSG